MYCNDVGLLVVEVASDSLWLPVSEKNYFQTGYYYYYYYYYWHWYCVTYLNPDRTSRSEDLPAPDGPMIAVNRPARNSPLRHRRICFDCSCLAETKMPQINAIFHCVKLKNILPWVLSRWKFRRFAGQWFLAWYMTPSQKKTPFK